MVDVTSTPSPRPAHPAVAYEMARTARLAHQLAGLGHGARL